MKSLIIPALALCLVPLTGAPMKKEERSRIVSHLEMTESWLADELKGLSKAQLNFKPSDGAWSILNVVEHLAVAEPQYWKDLQSSIKEARSEKKAEITDDQIMWYGIDRTQRNRTGEAREPKGQYDDVSKALGDFKKLRATMLEYARTTEDDLRGAQYKNSKMDAYQWLLMISAHSQRHILQIREIKAAGAFPRN
jgi:hypothetical protein